MVIDGILSGSEESGTNHPEELSHRTVDSSRYNIRMDYQNLITLEPGKRAGKPCIRGMRITVYDVLSYLAAGTSMDQLLDEFPYLTREDVLACLSFAADRERYTLHA